MSFCIISTYLGQQRCITPVVVIVVVVSSVVVVVGTTVVVALRSAVEGVSVASDAL